MNSPQAKWGKGKEWLPSLKHFPQWQVQGSAGWEVGGCSQWGWQWVSRGPGTDAQNSDTQSLPHTHMGEQEQGGAQLWEQEDSSRMWGAEQPDKVGAAVEDSAIMFCWEGNAPQMSRWSTGRGTEEVRSLSLQAGGLLTGERLPPPRGHLLH